MIKSKLDSDCTGRMRLEFIVGMGEGVSIIDTKFAFESGENIVANEKTIERYVVVGWEPHRILFSTDLL